jgi:peptidoglycan/LPS O-acetylase OafA/YrhL
VTAATTRTHPAGPIPSLDGVRALAVGLVFFAHGGPENLVPGGLGVTIFFVLSGYLITTLMRIEHASSGRIDYRAFYLRRLLRLMPPLFVVVAAAALLSAVSLIDGGFTTAGLLSALFYFGNYYVIAHDFHGLPAGIGVIWSLAIEEHYYLCFPPLAALLLRRNRVELSIVVLAAFCVAVLGWRCWLVYQGVSPAHLTMATDTRMDAILIGCLLALACNPWLDGRGLARGRYQVALAATSFALLLASLLWRDDVFRYTARYTVQSAAVAALLYLAVAHAGQLPFRWLNARPIAYVGTISYTVYLSHHVILLGLGKHWPQANGFELMLAGAVVTLLFAEAMRRWVEEPCARLRKRLHRGVRREKKAGALASAVSG